MDILGSLQDAAAIIKTVAPSVWIGLFLGNLLTLRSLPSAASEFGQILARLTGLPAEAALSVLLAVGDRTAGMASVAAARERLGLSTRQVLAANLTAKCPSVIQFFVFSFVPIALTLFPRNEALRFLINYFLAFLMISACGILMVRVSFRGGNNSQTPAFSPARGQELTWGMAIWRSVKRSSRPFLRTVIWMGGTSWLVLLALHNSAVAGILERLPFGLPSSALAVLGAGLLSMMGGVAAAGAAFQQGLIPKEALVPLLLLISIVHNCYDLFNSSLPRTVAIYGHKTGWTVAIGSFLVTQAVMITVYLLVMHGVL